MNTDLILQRCIGFKVTALLLLSLLVTGCAPALNATRYGDVVTVSYENDKSCYTSADLWSEANQECRKIGKAANVSPQSISNTKNMFCTATGAWKAEFHCVESGDAGGLGGAKAEVSRLELRAMQTRKFLKSPQAVASSISELYKDKNQQCLGVKPPVYACPSGISMTKTIKGKPVSYCANPDGTPAVDQQMIKRSDLSPDGFCVGGGYKTTFSIDTNYPESTTTTLRIRISNFKAGNPSETQVTNPAAYSKVFKEIADGLFIDAIELTPAEMQ